MASFLIDLKPAVITHQEDIPRLIQSEFKLYGKISSCIQVTDFEYVENDLMKLLEKCRMKYGSKETNGYNKNNSVLPISIQTNLMILFSEI